MRIAFRSILHAYAFDSVSFVSFGLFRRIGNTFEADIAAFFGCGLVRRVIQAEKEKQAQKSKADR